MDHPPEKWPPRLIKLVIPLLRYIRSSVADGHFSVVDPAIAK